MVIREIMVMRQVTREQIIEETQYFVKKVSDILIIIISIIVLLFLFGLLSYLFLYLKFELGIELF